MSSAPEGYRNLHHEKLACGKSLLELSTYDGIAWWWNAHFMFYTYLDLRLEAGPRPKPLPIRIALSLVRWFGIYIDLVYSLGLKILIAVFRRIDGGNGRWAIRGRKRILFVSSDVDWRDITDYEADSSRRGDALFHSIITLLKSEYDFIAVYPLDVHPIRGFRVAREKWRNREFRFLALNSYWKPRTWIKQRDAAAHFKRAWKLIKGDRKLRELCQIDGVDFYQQIKTDLALHFLVTLPLAVKYAQMGLDLVRSELPMLFLVKNEYGWRERSYAVIAPKKQGIPTMALQHGTIYPRHRGYIYLQRETSREGKVSSPYCPLPDRTLVGGQYYQRLLTELGGYPSSSILVTGQPRYDALADAKNRFPRNQYCEEYGIDPAHKIVLWATQCQGLGDEENERNYDAVFCTMKRLTGVTLVLKKHPGERREHIERAEQHLQDRAISVVIPSKDSNTYMHLACCDAMVTKSSTTATEAIVLDKPVIILNLSEEPDRVEYVREGVAHGVYRKEDLESAIKKALGGGGDLGGHRERFKQEYLMRCDGKATERVASIITSSMDGSRW